MSLFLVLVSQVLVNLLVTLVRSQSCGPRVSPRLLMEIPCDMTRSFYCSIPGSAYPWHSVRRYIYENQGLMKRMYGDQRHSLILQNEIENRRAKYDFNFFDKKAAGAAESGRSFFERAETLTSASPTTTTHAPPTDINPNHYYSPQVQHSEDTRFTTAVFTNKDEESSTSTDDATSGTILDFAAEHFLTNAPSGSTVPMAYGQDTPADAQQETTTHMTTPFATRTATTANSVPNTDNKQDSTSANNAGTGIHEPWLTTIGAGISSAPSLSPPPRDTATTSHDYLQGQGQDVNRPKVNIVSLNSLDKEPTSDEDKAAPPTVTEPLPRRGMNACPVKEEVIAPYWANNTRGETLALLNVYPFEQYVHWEKCAYENHQMFCRDGCRCEQQYRLHRMLAFDPKNECRGIFADWFRFPSCCVCICYNIPEEVERLFQRGSYRRGRNS